MQRFVEHLNNYMAREVATFLATCKMDPPGI